MTEDTTRPGARKRNRSAAVTAFAAVAVVGTLAVTLNAAQPDLGAPQDIETAANAESRAERLTAQLAEASLIPHRWRPAASPSPFSCVLEEHATAPADAPVPTEVTLWDGADTCHVQNSYADEEGSFELGISVSNMGMPFSMCMGANCFEVELRNGTKAQGEVTGVGAQPSTGGHEDLRAQQANIGLSVSVTWKNERNTPPLTADELLRFATVDYSF